ncbi:MAG: hypothetical protein JRJ84_09995 [Deltaproteobacteria bacterium]|nr:hypothetical protein [Deltaproteobacteria bacterium]
MSTISRFIGVLVLGTVLLGCKGEEEDTAVNRAPVADAGADQAGRVGVAVVLDGTASTDSDGDTLTFSWTIDTAPGGSAATLTGADTSTGGFTPDLPGEYVVSLVVSDGDLASDPATVTISINAAPVASAGFDHTLWLGGDVTLDGADSSDADGDTLTYAWSLDSQPGGSTATLSGATTATPTLTPDLPGDYGVSLVVHDGTEDSAADSLVITATVPRVAVLGDSGSPAIADGLAAAGLEALYYPAHRAMELGFSGDYLVWESLYDIYLYRLSTGVTVNLTSLPSTQDEPRIDGDYVVWEDSRGAALDVYGYQISTQTEFRISTSESGQNPEISGDYVVYNDSRNGNSDIFGYKLSTQTEFPITIAEGSQHSADIDGDYVVWVDATSGTVIDGYQISNTTPFTVSSNGNDKNPIIDGDYVIYETKNPSTDIEAYRISDGATLPFAVRAGVQHTYDLDGGKVVWKESLTEEIGVHLYDLATTTETVISPTTYFLARPKIDGDWVAYLDDADGHPDLYLYQISTETTHRVTDYDANKDWVTHQGSTVAWSDELTGYGDVRITEDLGANIDDLTSVLSAFNTGLPAFHAVVFGDSIGSDAQILTLFDAVDAQGVGVLGIGTWDNGEPLGAAFEDDGRYGILNDYSDGYAPMEIVATTAGQAHPIFADIDTTGVIVLESDSGENDEHVYSSTGDDKPADWTVLAEMGANMWANPTDLPGYGAIVEFTTPAGTTVLLDGSANTYDYYEYWNQTRWDLLTAEVWYLAPATP